MGMLPSRDRSLNIKSDIPYIFVANHVSMIDVMLLVSTVRKNPLVFIGKKEILKFPVLELLTCSKIGFPGEALAEFLKYSFSYVE